MNEDELVEKIASLAGVPGGTRVPIGDDAAVIDREAGALVATADTLVEEEDFLPDEEPTFVGRRAVAANLSDLAAMGARPERFLLSLALPAERGEEYVLALVRGAVARGALHGAALAGGDLSRAREVVVSIALWGRPAGPPLLRKAAQAGDLVFLTGAPGRASAGLDLEREGARLSLAGALTREDRSGFARAHPASAAELLAAFVDPEPRVAFACTLSEQRIARAAIDVSDGLGRDAGRIGRASGVCIALEEHLLPIAPALADYGSWHGTPLRERILSGGDDFEILFTATPADEPAIRRAADRHRLRVTRVGQCREGSGAVCRGPSGERDISQMGFDHFEQ